MRRMNTIHRRVRLTLAAAAALTVSPLVVGYSIDWSTIDAGGALDTTGGAYAISGTIGQFDAGDAMTGGAYELTGGFWAGGVGLAGDCNGDGFIDVSDLNDFAGCLLGPTTPAGGSCLCFDFDQDGAVTLADGAALQIFASGN